jgi:RNA-binding protein
VLSAKFKRELKQQAHHLHPVIIIGQHGLTPAVITETDKSLKAHELIKVKINHPERLVRKEMALDLSTATKADLVQTIGSMTLLYRPKPAEAVKKIVKKAPIKGKSKKTYTRTNTKKAPVRKRKT